MQLILAEQRGWQQDGRRAVLGTFARSMPLTDTLDQICEVDLLAQVSARNADALSLLYDRTAPVLFGVARSILRDDALAEDVVQEAYAQIWEKAESYQPALGKPISWMIALTRNRALDKLRAAKRRDWVVEDEALENEPDPRVDIPEITQAAEASRAIRAALQSLGEKPRRALELAFFDGLAHAEVAVAMNEPLGTVKAWIRRGMLDLRPKLEKFL